jgi:methylmalonyl-CoA mutase, N-terminal domain
MKHNHNGSLHPSASRGRPCETAEQAKPPAIGDGTAAESGAELTRIRHGLAAWEQRHEKAFATETKEKFLSEEGIEIKRVYTPADLAERGFDYLSDVGFPGSYPFTRAISPTQYRSGLWRISQYSGYATPEECNDLWRAQVRAGLNTIYVAYDLPTQLGYDPDHPQAEGEVGRVGASLVSLRDWEIAFDGIDIQEAIISQVFNAPAAIGIAMHLAFAEKRGVPWQQLKGIIQNDILKEYIARGNYIFPPEPAIRLVVDGLEFTAREMPNYIPITVCTYHFPEQGADRVHEVAFALADAMAYLDAARDRGIDLDLICPHIMWLASHEHSGFFDEVAKLRAIRKLWSRITKERFHVTKPESMMCRLYSGQSGLSLCKEQYVNNIARISISALAAALAGVQTIDLRTYDEQWGIPSKEAELTNVRIQQVVGYETGITDTVDPLGGSYYVESLTLDLEKRIAEEIKRVDRLGGMLRAIQAGYPQNRNFDDACRFQKQVEAGEIVRVGFNRFREKEDTRPQRVYRAKPETEGQRIKSIQELRRNRDNGRVEHELATLKRLAAKPASKSGNLIPPLIDAVRAYATVGEICTALREVWGEFSEPVVV